MKVASFSLLTAALLALLPTAVSAQDDKPLVSLSLGEQIKLVPHLQYRPRFEFHGRKDFDTGESYKAFSHRARLGLDATILKWFKVSMQVQDVRTWGEELNTLGDYVADGFDVHQAYAELGCPYGLKVRIGRQEIAFDNQRIVGAVDWTQQARAFDAIRLDYNWGKLNTTIFYSKVSESEVYQATTNADGSKTTTKGAEADVDVGALWASYGGFKALQPSLLLLFDRDNLAKRNRFTLGLHLKGSPITGLTYSGEFYFQTGTQGGGTSEKNISSFLAALRAGYQIQVKTKPQFEFWFDYVSGDDDQSDDTIKTFDTLFATNHKFYGYMDFFLNLPKQTAGFGLIDVGGRFKMAPAKGFAFWLDWHWFNFAEEYRTSEARARNMGHEFDLVAAYKFNNYFKIVAGASVFVPRLGITCLTGKCQLDNRDAEYWGFVMTDLAF